MNKIIPFTKVISLNETFDEIKKIALDDTLKLDNPYLVKGDLIVRGCYKTDDKEEDFNYPMPVEIAIDEKYDTSNCSIAIDDFYYEIINEQNIRIKIDIVLDDLFYKEKQEKIKELSVVDERNDVKNDFEEIAVDNDLEDNLLVNTLLNDNDVKNADKFANNSNMLQTENDVNNIDKLNNNASLKEEKTKDFKESMEDLFKETSEDKEYCIYRVYVMNENDTLEYVLNKYQVTREDLMPFNELDKLQVGTKLIIPSIDE